MWTSRLLLKQDSISKSIAEAIKWGGHTPEVIAEKNRIRLGMYKLQKGSVKRCQFCWTILTSDEKSCPYCRALQEVTPQLNKLNPRKNTIVQAANRYVAALKEDKNNVRISFALVLAFYNIGELTTAMKYAQYIHRLLPGDVNCQKDIAAIKTLTGEKDDEFRSNIPEKQVDDNHIKPVAQPTELPAYYDSSEAEGEGPKILVVEDSPTAQKVINMLLAREGYTIIPASNGGEALQKAEEHNPELVLLDVMLPDTTGYDVLEKLRKNENLKKTPVVMLTGKKGAMDRARGIAAGTSDYLTKPFNPEKLTSTIKRYVKR